MLDAVFALCLIQTDCSVPAIIHTTIPANSDIDFLQEMMSEHRSRGVTLEYDTTVGEIKDNMKSILGKVNSSGGRGLDLG